MYEANGRWRCVVVRVVERDAAQQRHGMCLGRRQNYDRFGELHVREVPAAAPVNVGLSAELLDFPAKLSA